jgi:hypothetical protein
MFVFAFLIAVSGVQPRELVDISIIVGTVVVPWTYYPILRATADAQLTVHPINSRI